jgi:hypothetical protein
MNGDESGDAAAFGEDLAHAMTGRLGRGHAHVDARHGNDGLEVDVESMREHQQLARAQVRPNFFGIEFCRGLIGNQNHHHVGPLCRFGDRGHFKACLLRLGDGLRCRGQAHLYLNTGILQVESMGVALGAVADDGYLFRLDEGEVGIVIVVCRSHDFLGFPFLLAS